MKCNTLSLNNINETEKLTSNIIYFIINHINKPQIKNKLQSLEILQFCIENVKII